MFWKRRNAELSCLWNTSTAEEEETARPQYHGPLRISPVTDEPERHFPSQKRYIRYAITIPINLIVLGVVVAVMVGLLYLRDVMPKDNIILSNIPSVLNAVVVLIFDKVSNPFRILHCGFAYLYFLNDIGV